MWLYKTCPQCSFLCNDFRHKGMHVEHSGWRNDSTGRPLRLFETYEVWAWIHPYFYSTTSLHIPSYLFLHYTENLFSILYYCGCHGNLLSFTVHVLIRLTRQSVGSGSQSKLIERKSVGRELSVFPEVIYSAFQLIRIFDILPGDAVTWKFHQCAGSVFFHWRVEAIFHNGINYLGILIQQ